MNLIAILQFTVHFKSANVYVMFEVRAILTLVFIVFSIRINKACLNFEYGRKSNILNNFSSV